MPSNQMPYESADVVELTGIRPIYLNKFVERQLYGIEPSARSGSGRGSRRWFTKEDVYGIALVWWLFEAGLRTEVIKRVLREVGKSRFPDANRAAEAIRDSAAEFLVIEREPRLSETKAEKTRQKVYVAFESDVIDEVRTPDRDSIRFLHALPIAKLFAHLTLQFQLHER